MIGGNTLEAADRDRFGLGLVVLLDPSAATGRFAGAVAGAAENAGEDVRLPVDHVGVAITPRSDHPDVFGNGGMGGTRPLTVHDLVEIVGCCDIGGLQKPLLPGWALACELLLPAGSDQFGAHSRGGFFWLPNFA